MLGGMMQSIGVGGTVEASELNLLSGNVGIGTASPAGRLDVSSGAVNVSAGDLVVDTDSGLPVVYVGRINSVGGNNTQFAVRDRLNAIKFYVDSASSGDSYFRTGNVGIGTTNPSAKLDITSTTGGFLPPRMTTTQRDAISTPATGLVIYNTTTNVLNFYNGTSWGAV